MKEDIYMKETKNEIIIYQPSKTTRLEVRFKNNTVWLNRQQMAELFGRDIKTIGKHIANALSEELSEEIIKSSLEKEPEIFNNNRSLVNNDGLLEVAPKDKTYQTDNVSTVAKFATIQKEGNREIVRYVEYYSLDVILSVGYRIKSAQGILFRNWANTVLRNYLMRGYAFNQRFNDLEDKIDRRFAKTEADVTELREKVDFFVQTSLPPVQGVFYDGQVFDAEVFVAKHILSAKRSILLIDNYVNITTLEMLAKKEAGVRLEIVTSKRGNELTASDIEKFNEQYGNLIVIESTRFHDRFLIIDDEDLFLVGASIKDLGKKCFAFTKLDSAEISGLKARI